MKVIQKKAVDLKPGDMIVEAWKVGNIREYSRYRVSIGISYKDNNGRSGTGRSLLDKEELVTVLADDTECH